jgi:hypothetical protein
MSRDQAAAFVQALNLAQHYLPPLIFAQIAGNPICHTLAALASGAIELQAKSVPGRTASGDAGGQ